MNKGVESKIIIAIDGCSSSGKSTVAKEIAKKLGYIYIDTGAMYRAVTLYALQNKFADNQNIDSKQIADHLHDIRIEFKYNPEANQNETYLNGKNVEDEIRQLKVSSYVSLVAALPEVREEMVRQQQKMGLNKGLVMDGRDIGTVVFPEAELKIFMTASTEERARRRFLELKNKGQDITYESVLNNLEERDRLDSTRTISPLKKAKDSLTLDNSTLNREEQLNWILDKVEQKLKGHTC